MGPTHKELKKIIKAKHQIGRTAKRIVQPEIILIFFMFSSFQIFFLRFTKTCPSEFVGINTESALRDEGYA